MSGDEGAADVGPWRSFWLASELSAATAAGFAERINDSVPPDARSLAGRFVYPGAPAALARVDDRVARAIAARSSVRTFAPGRMTASQVGAVFGAFTSWPSAGALYPLHVFAVLFDVDSPMAGRVVHYERDVHGLSDVGPAPTWAEAREPLGGTVLEGAPPGLVVVFVLDTGATEAKYGNRGGRFALIEAGAAAQNLSLRVAASGLAGCLLGGAYDRAVASMLGLDRRGGPPLLVPLTYAVGLPARRPKRRFGRAQSRIRD